MELTRILEHHPAICLDYVTSRAEAGKKLRDVYPFLQGFRGGDLSVMDPDPDALAEHCELVFLAVPHGAAMDLAAALRARGTAVVDLSADYRLRDAAVFAAWYKTEHRRPEVLAEAVYGLPELHAEAIARAKMVANPGCYPTSAVLALAPALRGGFIVPEDIVIDAKSGVSGAGRKAVTGNLYCEAADTFKAYNLLTHRHTPEIEQELGLVAGREITVSFNTHLLPVTRGILSTIYTRPVGDLSPEEIRAAYERDYAPHPFVRILPPGAYPELRNVRGTMFCDLAFFFDPRTGRLIILSAIDNLCRGASGQAVANANLMTGLPVETGLLAVPMTP
jgi:N-acetyl-gamma-glutamyl-phosphate reductase